METRFTGAGGPKHPLKEHPMAKAMKEDFRKFQAMIWKEGLGLPKPTKMQQLFGDTLQKSKDRLLCLLGYRGFSKTYISVTYLLWELYKNPKLQIAIWAANQENAGDSTKLMLDLIQKVPWLQHLAPAPDMNQSKLSFDVKGRGTFRGSSVAAKGITGTVTGTRADILLVDDPETSSNGDTAKRRIQIDRAMSEAVNVFKAATEDVMTRIIVLGTVHFDDNLYARLINQGYTMYLFPICVPSLETQKMCWDYYLQPLKEMMKKHPEGFPLDRFSEDEIELRRGQGLLNFERQYLVNPFRTSLSQKPFDLRKIIIFQADSEMVPMKFYHNQDDAFLANDAMNFSSAALTDKLYKPYQFDSTMKRYDRIIAWVDPAGSGADETALAIMGTSSGYAFLLHIEGMIGGSKEENLIHILEACRKHKVDTILIESNFGQEMFAQLLRGVQQREYGRFGRSALIPIDVRRSTSNKQNKILAAIDPVLNSGRLVITPQALQHDYESANLHLTEDKMCYRVTYQLSYFSISETKLEHDDRIEALACCCEELKDYLVEMPEMHDKNWLDSLIEKAFNESEAQFQPEGTKPMTTRVDFLETRSSFL